MHSPIRHCEASSTLLLAVFTHVTMQSTLKRLLRHDTDVTLAGLAGADTKQPPQNSSFLPVLLADFSTTSATLIYAARKENFGCTHHYDSCLLSHNAIDGIDTHVVRNKSPTAMSCND
jgi:hypothetical protein